MSMGGNVLLLIFEAIAGTNIVGCIHYCTAIHGNKDKYTFKINNKTVNKWIEVLDYI